MRWDRTPGQGDSPDRSANTASVQETSRQRTDDDVPHVLTIRGPDLVDHRKSELTGLLAGLAHARAPDHGMTYLVNWLVRREELHEEYPVPELLHVLTPLLHRADRFDPDSNEADGKYLERIHAALRLHRPHLVARSEDLHARADVPYDDPVPPIEFPGHGFIFTGLFDGCERGMAERLTEAYGGIIHPRAVQKADYLVVGSRAHPGWKTSSQGRKIQNILTWRRDDRTDCRIVSEHDWIRALINAPTGIGQRTT